MSQTVLTDVFMTPEEYEEAALEFQRGLTIEDIMEAHILTLLRGSFLALLMLKRNHPQLQVFSEVLVQYPFDGELHRVVPDNMLVLNSDPSREWNRTSYNLEYERDNPFLVVEYVSTDTAEKDRDDGASYHKYEHELRVPYYLIYDPDAASRITLHRHNGVGYEQQPANADGRFEVPELDLEIGVDDILVRYWHQGSLLPIPTEVQKLLAEKEDALVKALAEKEDALRQISARDELANKLKLAVNAALEAARADLVPQLIAAENLASLEAIMKDIQT